MQPPAQAVGKIVESRKSPEGAKEQLQMLETAKRYRPSIRQGRGHYDSAAQAEVRELTASSMRPLMH